MDSRIFATVCGENANSPKEMIMFCTYVPNRLPASN